jgi:hypothetical protein
MSDTLSSRNGLAATSILTMLIARSSRRTSQCWRSSGRGPRPHDALAARSMLTVAATRPLDLARCCQ